MNLVSCCLSRPRRWQDTPAARQMSPEPANVEKPVQRVAGIAKLIALVPAADQDGQAVVAAVDPDVPLPTIGRAAPEHDEVILAWPRLRNRNVRPDGEPGTSGRRVAPRQVEIPGEPVHRGAAPRDLVFRFGPESA